MACGESNGHVIESQDGWRFPLREFSSFFSTIVWLLKIFKTYALTGYKSWNWCGSKSGSPHTSVRLCVPAVLELVRDGVEGVEVLIRINDG